MSEYGYLAHYGVKGMKWGVRKEMMKEYGAMHRARKLAYRKDKSYLNPLSKDFNKYKSPNTIRNNIKERRAADKAAFEKKYGEGSFRKAGNALSKRRVAIATAGALGTLAAVGIGSAIASKHVGKGNSEVKRLALEDKQYWNTKVFKNRSPFTEDGNLKMQAKTFVRWANKTSNREKMMFDKRAYTNVFGP